jgi:membrane-bound lytic murein transglycosylase D
MHTARATLALAALLTACSTTRHVAPVPRPLPAPARPAPHAKQAEAAPVAKSDALSCVTHARIDHWEQKQRLPRSADQAALARGAHLLPHMKQLVADAGIPPTLALLPAIESGFRPEVRGRAGERGLWQLRPRTARRFGLVVTAQRDDRLAVDPATRAAARYLSLLHDRYDDWPLALAAYNAGETRVDRALARRPRATFWQLADADLLPRGTKEFVPRFFGLARLDGPCPGDALLSRAR